MQQHCRAWAQGGAHADEEIRSAQLYGVRPDEMHAAAKKLVEEFGVQHIDLNFGCPVRKVTSRGGGAAIPLKLGLLRDLVAAALRGAGDVPVTVKMRVGISPRLVRTRRAPLDRLCPSLLKH